MQRWKIGCAVTAATLVLSGVSMAGQGQGGGPKTQTSSPKGGAQVTKPTQTTKGGSQASAKGATTAADAKTKTTTRPAKTDSPASAHTTKSTKSGKSTTSTTDTTTSTSTSTTTTEVTLSAVQQKLQKNTKLAEKLSSRLPKGTDLMAAAADFPNLGQFVAAVNVSNNLGIEWVDMRSKMIDEHKTLGEAIQALKPTASSTIEAQRAEYEARGMIQETEGTQTTTTTKPKPKKKGSGSTSGGGGTE